jgi:hypothetical protein
MEEIGRYRDAIAHDRVIRVRWDRDKLETNYVTETVGQIDPE